MRSIDVVESQSTGLEAHWDRLRSIELETAFFSEGAFGELFECRLVDGRRPPHRLVVKIFKRDGSGNDARGYATIRRLQERLRKRHLDGAGSGQPMTAVPGLHAIPRFSFEGRMGSQLVRGYAAHELDRGVFASLDDVLQSRFPEFRRLDLNRKLQLALDLTECLGILRDVNYIHADINPQNLFVSLQTGHLVLIDYDSGTVFDRPGDAPTTFGKQNEWLAPEVCEQLTHTVGGQQRVTVDLFTDMWSVAVGIHYFLFAQFPYFYLKVLGPTDVRDYLSRYRWPDVDTAYPNFNPTQRRVYADYVDNFRSADPVLRRALELTFGEGALRRDRRTSYGQWIPLLRDRVRPMPFVPQRATSRGKSGARPATPRPTPSFQPRPAAPRPAPPTALRPAGVIAVPPPRPRPSPPPPLTPPPSPAPAAPRPTPVARRPTPAASPPTRAQRPAASRTWARALGYWMAKLWRFGAAHKAPSFAIAGLALFAAAVFWGGPSSPDLPDRQRPQPQNPGSPLQGGGSTPGEGAPSVATPDGSAVTFPRAVPDPNAVSPAPQLTPAESGASSADPPVPGPGAVPADAPASPIESVAPAAPPAPGNLRPAEAQPAKDSATAPTLTQRRATAVDEIRSWLARAGFTEVAVEIDLTTGIARLTGRVMETEERARINAEVRQKGVISGVIDLIRVRREEMAESIGKGTFK